MNLIEIKFDQIKTCDLQPSERKFSGIESLKESIHGTNGWSKLYPGTVYKTIQENDFVLVSGTRRMEAAKAAGFDSGWFFVVGCLDKIQGDALCFAGGFQGEKNLPWSDIEKTEFIGKFFNRSQLTLKQGEEILRAAGVNLAKSALSNHISIYNDKGAFSALRDGLGQTAALALVGRPAAVQNAVIAKASEKAELSKISAGAIRGLLAEIDAKEKAGKEPAQEALIPSPVEGQGGGGYSEEEEGEPYSGHEDAEQPATLPPAPNVVLRVPVSYSAPVLTDEEKRMLDYIIKFPLWNNDAEYTVQFTRHMLKMVGHKLI